MSHHLASIIYVEPAYHESCNQLIRQNLSRLQWRAEHLDCEFVYIPAQIEQGDLQRELTYFFPNEPLSTLQELVRRPDFVQRYYDQLPGAPFDQPQLLLHGDDSSAALPFPQNGVLDDVFSVMSRLVRLNNEDSQQDFCLPSFAVIHQSLSRDRFLIDEDSVISDESCLFENNSVCAALPSQIPPDMDADAEAEALEHIERLKELGFSLQQLIDIFRLTKPEVSRLVITPDFRFVLTDYQDLVVSFPDLSKALYLLYLNHPEGIAFKCLGDYRDELYRYYRTLSGRTNDRQQISSIEGLVDTVTNNSANEKNSRIKAAFLKLIAPELADPYLIAKGPDGLHRIALDRKMVEDQAHILGSNNLLLGRQER